MNKSEMGDIKKLGKEKECPSIPLHMVNLDEMLIVSIIVSIVIMIIVLQGKQ